jgi:predicted nucleotidyltransferase
MPAAPNDLIERIRKLDAPIRAQGATGLYLYGSRGRGDFRPDSDVDIFVDYDAASDFSIVELVRIKRILESALGHDVHVTTRRGLSGHFRQQVEREAVRVL